MCLGTSRHIRTQITVPIGSMYAIYGNIYHQYTLNFSIYSIHGSYGVDTLSIFVCEHIDLLWLCTVRVLALQLYPSRTFNCKPGAQDCVSLPSLPTFPGKLGDLGKPCKHHPIIHQLQLVKLEDPS